MKTAKEFIEKLRTDEAFGKQVNESVRAKKDAGAKDYVEAVLAVAAELGYEVTREQVEGLRARQEESISEEELGKAAGGTLCLWSIAVAISASVAASAAVSINDAVNDSTGC